MPRHTAGALSPSRTADPTVRSRRASQATPYDIGLSLLCPEDHGTGRIDNQLQERNVHRQSSGQPVDGHLAASFEILVPDLTQTARRQDVSGRAGTQGHRRSHDVGAARPSRHAGMGLRIPHAVRAEPAPQQRTDELIARLTDYIRSLQMD